MEGIATISGPRDAMASKIYDSAWLDDTIRRLARDIVYNRTPRSGKALVGLRTRGAILADRLRSIIAVEHGLELPIGYLDATLYRDDLHTGAGLKAVKPSEIDFDLNDRDLILVDDVLYTGRSIRAAMGALFDYGRPSCIRLCSMIDRGGRELPIHPDFLGVKIETPKGGFVRLRLSEIDPQGDAVYVVGPGEPEP
jgi:pyrimidine operon attenuation protein/uracil phosphoribosyltransferase